VRKDYSTNIHRTKVGEQPLSVWVLDGGGGGVWEWMSSLVSTADTVSSRTALGCGGMVEA
jgi:hypothetical protein